MASFCLHWSWGWRSSSKCYAEAAIRFDTVVSLRSELQHLEASLDTMVIEPDEQRVVCCWRASFPCPRQFLHIDYVRIKELERTA